jgi:hypothetical protein
MKLIEYNCSIINTIKIVKMYLMVLLESNYHFNCGIIIILSV